MRNQKYERSLQHGNLMVTREEDRLFLVHLPEFPCQEFHTHGKTYEEAAKNGREVIETFVEMLIEENKPLPKPRILPTKPLQVA
jgi:predicted RNase H-like HicB family nuclease